MKGFPSRERFPLGKQKVINRLLLSLALFLSLISSSFSQTAKEAPSPLRFETDIKAMEDADQKSLPAPGGILFVGSSSIRLWKSLADDFPGLPVLNRGFGGALIGEVLYYSDRIILPYKPRLMVLYIGGNDVAQGIPPEEILATFKTLTDKIRAQLPQTRLLYISINPSIARWHLDAQNRKTDELISAYIARSGWMTFINARPKMLGTDGKPRPDLWIADNLHLNENGYRLWKEILAPYLK
jgi:lysophospholipase L1-like esterase